MDKKKLRVTGWPRFTWNNTSSSADADKPAQRIQVSQSHHLIC